MKLADIRKELKNGRNKLEAFMREHMELSMIEYADLAVLKAIEYYMSSHSKNLTGNTIAGFSAGVYVNGNCVLVRNAIEVAKDVRPPTSGYTKPGMKGFNDYDSGEQIGGANDPFVQDYNEDSGLFFNSTNVGGSSIDDTYNFLMNQHPPKKRITVIVANVSPYINFLHRVRRFDILDSASNGSVVEEDVIKAFIKTKLKEDNIIF